MPSIRSANFLIGLIVYVASGERIRQVFEGNRVSLATNQDPEGVDGAEEENEADETDSDDPEALAEEEAPDEGNSSPTEGTADSPHKPDTTDSSPDEEAAGSSTRRRRRGSAKSTTNSSSKRTADPSLTIDTDKLSGMKKSEIWAVIEDNSLGVKKAEAGIRSRQRKQNREARKLRKQWEAVQRKFKELRAASRAEQKDIDAAASRVKMRKKELGKLKSEVYKMR